MSSAAYRLATPRLFGSPGPGAIRAAPPFGVQRAPERHPRVPVRLQEVRRLDQEESAGSFNRAFQTFESEASRASRSAGRA